MFQSDSIVARTPPAPPNFKVGGLLEHPLVHKVGVHLTTPQVRPKTRQRRHAGARGDLDNTKSLGRMGVTKADMSRVSIRPFRFGRAGQGGHVSSLEETRLREETAEPNWASRVGLVL